MTDVKFCDLHKSEQGRQQPKENFQTVRLEAWRKVGKKNVLFENKLDICLGCVKELFEERAVGLKVNYSGNWRTQVLRKGKNDKWQKKWLTPDELAEFLEEEEKERELAELRARAK